MADKMMKLADISALPEVQVRGGLNSAQVAELRDLLDGGVDLDPLDVFHNPADPESPNILSDGFHRKAAYEQSGREKAPVTLHEGGMSEALEFAMKNCRHGNPMTNAGKRSAVKMALADIRIKRMSDKRIAKMCGVSASLVADARSGKLDKPAKERKPREAKASSTPAPQAEPAQRYEPGPTASRSTGGSGQALAPVVTHERTPASEPNKVDTIDEKLKAIESWLKAGYLDLPAIVSCAETKKHRLIMIPKKDLCFVIATEGQPLREYKIEKLDMVEGKIQVELKEGELL